MSNDDSKRIMLEFQRSGDRDACRRLFLMHRDPLWRFLLRLSGSEADANDLSQRVWLRIIETAERKGYRPVENASFQTYLFTIARNLVIDEGRSLRARALRVDESTLESMADATMVPMEEFVQITATARDVRQALLKLPLEQREVLAMWGEGLGLSEIATIVGVPRNTVIGRKRYGLEKLRKLLAKESVDFEQNEANI
jgi:RNA polymerase sigma-70 factor (ECF subfamily)